MPIFSLSCSVTVSAYTEVEAETLADAIDIASSRYVVIGGFGGEDKESEWIIDNADGDPMDIHEV